MNQSELLEALDYCPETGRFSWKVRRNGRLGGVRPGDAAGKLTKNGYISIGLFGREWLAHRLAVLFMTGAMPIGDVDHINGSRSDNRWINLRDITHSLNLHNRSGPQKNNSSGALGVYQRDGKWRAEICIQGHKRRLGTYSTKEDASEAYRAAKRLLGT